MYNAYTVSHIWTEIAIECNIYLDAPASLHTLSASPDFCKPRFVCNNISSDLLKAMYPFGGERAATRWDSNLITKSHPVSNALANNKSKSRPSIQEIYSCSEIWWQYRIFLRITVNAKIKMTWKASNSGKKRISICFCLSKQPHFLLQFSCASDLLDFRNQASQPFLES